VKTPARIGLIAAASLAAAILTVGMERMMREPSARETERRTLRHRAAEPNFSRLPQAIGQLVLYLALGATGRYVLRLRL
jgi:hypothetical protein